MNAHATMRQPADPVIEAAVRWKALLASGDLSPADQREFESWQAENVRHTRASDLVDAKVASVCDAIAGEGVLAMIEARCGAAPPPHARPLVVASSERREALRAGAQTFLTAPGDHADLVTDDGSFVRLQPSSEIHAAFDDGVWTLTLRRGAIFVSRSPRAPGTMLFAFPADRGGVLRVERGTEATIDIRASETMCVVASGRCVVTTDDDDRVIDAGFGTSFNRHLCRPEQADFDEAFDWVEDRLIARSRPLHAVIGRIRPLSPVPIVVEKALEDRTIDGEYRPRDTKASLCRIADQLRTTLHCDEDRYTLGNPAGA